MTIFYPKLSMFERALTRNVKVTSINVIKRRGLKYLVFHTKKSSHQILVFDEDINHFRSKGYTVNDED